MNIMILIIKVIMILAFTVFIARFSIKLSFSLLSDAGCALKNYRGNEVVFGMGIAFLPILITTTALLFFFDRNQYETYMPYLFAVCAMGFAALLDDFIGNKQVKGLRNHILSFFRGQLTTGFIKAFIGFGSSVVISLGISNTISEFLLNMFNIALFTNAMNLMDLRPGRCTKVFLTISLVIISINLENIILLLPLLIMTTSAMIYLRYDLKELCMLGDTGSNILGITLGYFSSISFDSTGKIITFLILLTINIMAEKISISKLIANNRLLSYLDNLGRSS